MSGSSTTSFGGEWTVEKLQILRRYLDAYTTALKNQRFNLLYIDAFAGSGSIHLNDADATSFITGSATIAVEVDDKPFDRLIFIEKDSARCNELSRLENSHPSRNIEIQQEDANMYLQELCSTWEITYSRHRGVLFLDPFATQVEWATVQAVAGTNALDVWLLFPVSAIARMLPRTMNPEDFNPTLSNVLNRVFGDENWKSLYEISSQGVLFNDQPHERKPGLKRIITTYKNKLKTVVGKSFFANQKPSKTQKNRHFLN